MGVHLSMLTSRTRILIQFYLILYYKGLFRIFELRVLSVRDCPKIAGAKALMLNRPQYNQIAYKYVHHHSKVRI